MLLRTNIQNLIAFSMLALSAFATAQTETPATVPTSFVGTYETTFESFNPSSPLATGDLVTVVIGSDNSLCVNGTLLTNPVLRNGNPAEGFWVDSAASIDYAVSNLTGGFNEINVGGPGGQPFYGQLSGSKVSDSTSCDTSSESGGTTPVATDAINQIFALAEAKLPEIFAPGAITLTFEQYIYRLYPDTGVYLAFLDDAVFLLGGTFGETPVNIGPVSLVLATLEEYEAPVDTGNTPSPSIDLWTLTISGTFNTSLVQNLAFSGISIADVPAPDLSDTDAIDTEIDSTLAGLASGISSISITVVNNTETRRTFDVEFSATAPGLGSVSYSLRYDYTR